MVHVVILFLSDSVHPPPGWAPQPFVGQHQGVCVTGWMDVCVRECGWVGVWV